MKDKSSYSIQSFGALIVVDLNGNWSVQDDLTYISKLSEEIAEVKSQSWAVLVDMRGWKGQAKDAQSTYKITLDRRNQKAEYWLVDYPTQADYLLPFFAKTTVRPQKFLDPAEAKLTIQNAGYDLSEVNLAMSAKKTSQTDL